MQLWSEVSLWEYHHPEYEHILDTVVLDSRINKDTLWDNIIFEFGELECVDSSFECFWKHLQTFFKKWNLPISELMNTLEYKYDPLQNVNYQVERNLSREVQRELGRDFVSTLASAIKKAIDQSDTYADTRSGNDDRAIKDDEATNTSNTHTDSHYVSAFNQIQPPDTDTYDNRDAGNWTETTTINQDKTDSLAWSDKKNSTDTIDRDEDTTRNDDATERTDENEKTGTGENEGTKKVGTDRVSFQELIQEQRDIVVFNIYNWISDKFAKEFLIQLW